VALSHAARQIKNLTAAKADELAGTDPDYARGDLHDAIERGEFPKWRVSVQVMPEAEAETYHIHPFDLTKAWPHKDYPLIEVGIMELNANPKNYFNEVEQAAFSPVNIVPGMGYSPDKMLQARLISYPDAHRYRLGVNFETLPVNRPQCPVNTYNRDGFMRANDNGGENPNYEPNSLGGPAQAHDAANYRTRFPARSTATITGTGMTITSSPATCSGRCLRRRSRR
jgi:catalase